MKKALILDVSYILYKSFFRLKNMSNSKGMPTGALFGLVNNLLSLIKEFKPEYVVACFDESRSSLKRREIYPEYKSNRDSAPDALVPQMKYSRDLLESFGIHTISKEGYEADDMIASYTKFFNDNGIETYISTGDKDLMQLIGYDASIISSGKEGGIKLISTEEDVKDKIGVFPNQILDLFALQGDSSDSIPGVKGIGPKTASKLISQFETLDNLYDNLDNLQDKLRDKLDDNREIAYLSKELATLLFLDIKDNIQTLEYNGFKDNLYSLLKELEFKSIINKLDLIDNNKEEVQKKEEIDILEVEKYDLSTLNKDKDNNLEVSIYFDSSFYYIYLKDKIVKTENISMERYKGIVNTYNSKEIYKKHSFNLGIDFMLAHHLLFPEDRSSIERAINQIFNIELDKKELSVKYFGKDKIKEMLKLSKLEGVYEDIEKKIPKILAYMEMNGIEIDTKYLEEYGKEIDERMLSLNKNIEDMAGESFNLSSPKQLSFILFEKMGIKPVKKTKTGYSTNSEVLSFLSKNGEEIATSLLEYRKLSKLSSTYISSLINIADKSRIHTTYHQNGTATGRLSSSNPNLQNIPSRTEDGRRVKRAFISGKGKKLIVADYSQIELRILASFSEDKSLISAFKKNIDLHDLTASRVFNSILISKTERERAKVINYSLVYGKCAYSLSKELDISVKEAQSYIDRYFEEYSGVRKYMDSVVEKARVDGFVKTMFGRKRFLKDINNKNRTIKAAAERTAVNSIIQGTQSEIIKKAMVNIYEDIKSDKNIKMLLQVHDELVFEVNEDLVEEYSKKIEKFMINSVNLKKVPIKVNINSATNWKEAK